MSRYGHPPSANESSALDLEPQSRAPLLEGTRARQQVLRDRWFVAIMLITLFYSVGPFLIQSLTVDKFKTSAGTITAPTSALAGRADRLSSLLLMIVCVAAVIRSVASFPTTGRTRLLVLLAPWLFIVLDDAFGGSKPFRTEFIYPLVVIAGFFLRPRLRTLRWLGYSVGAVALISILMGLLDPSKGIFQLSSGVEITSDKQIFSSGILVGPFPQGNNLGVFLVMGMATIFAVGNRTTRVVLLGLALYAQLWAASRSCLGAAAIVLLFALTLRHLPSRTRASLLWLVLAAELAFLVLVPLLTTDVLAFTNRGYIWQVSRQAWSVNKWFGRGSNYYARVATTSANLGGSVFHGHNQLMQALVTGGIIYALLLGLVVVVAIGLAVRLARQGSRVPAYWCAAFIGACTLEVSFAVVDRYYDLAVMLVPLVCIFFNYDEHHATPDPAGRAATPPGAPGAGRRASAGPNRAVGLHAVGSPAADTIGADPSRLSGVSGGSGGAPIKTWQVHVAGSRRNGNNRLDQ